MLDAIAGKLDRGIEELRAGTLQESTLAAIRDEILATGSVRQDLLYLQAASTSLDAQVIGMRLVSDGEISDGPGEPDDWPYQTVLEAIRDGWRIIDFPNLALLLGRRAVVLLCRPLAHVLQPTATEGQVR